MQDKRLLSWKGFLPKHAVVMVPSSSVSEVTPAAPVAAHTPDTPDTLDSIARELAGCTRCKLGSLGRHTVVFGEGNPRAELVFVGEGPGETEDQTGRPFVGKAGQLLDRMIQAMGVRREDVYICNVVKCRPPGNRNPEPDEVATCSPFLRRQLALIRPKLIVALGKFAAQTLLNTEMPITRLRGQWGEYSGVRVMPTFHPSYLLRNPAAKKEVWQDLQSVAHALRWEIPHAKKGEA